MVVDTLREVEGGEGREDVMVEEGEWWAGEWEGEGVGEGVGVEMLLAAI